VSRAVTATMRSISFSARPIHVAVTPGWQYGPIILWKTGAAAECGACLLPARHRAIAGMGVMR
jgi:hypothetical protein